MDRNFALPIARKTCGGLRPNGKVLHRSGIGVLFARQHLSSHVFGQLDVINADRTGVASCQINLTFIGEDEFARELRGIRMLAVLVENRRIAAHYAAFRRNHDFKAVAVNLIAVVERIEIPQHTDFNFPFFEIGHTGSTIERRPCLAILAKKS